MAAWQLARYATTAFPFLYGTGHTACLDLSFSFSFHRQWNCLWSCQLNMWLMPSRVNCSLSTEMEWNRRRAKGRQASAGSELIQVGLFSRLQKLSQTQLCKSQTNHPTMQHDVGGGDGDDDDDAGCWPLQLGHYGLWWPLDVWCTFPFRRSANIRLISFHPFVDGMFTTHRPARLIRVWGASACRNDDFAALMDVSPNHCSNVTIRNAPVLKTRMQQRHHRVKSVRAAQARWVNFVDQHPSLGLVSLQCELELVTEYTHVQPQDRTVSSPRRHVCYFRNQCPYLRGCRPHNGTNELHLSTPMIMMVVGSAEFWSEIKKKVCHRKQLT